MKRPWYVWLLFVLVGLPAYPYGRGLISWWTTIGAMFAIGLLIRLVVDHLDRTEAQKLGK
jgi:hypothetical protein